MKQSRWEYLPHLFASIVCIVAGIWMILNNKVGIGIDGLTQQLTSGGGPLLILIGFILLGVTYFSLSPFSKLRQFFEGSSKRKKHKG